MQNALNVVVGATNRNTGGTFLQSSRIHIHPMYDVRSRSNDVSLVQTAQVIMFNAHVQPIRIGSTIIPGGVPVVASGWNMPGENPILLSTRSLQTITNLDCRTRRTAAGNNPDYVYENIICTDTMNPTHPELCHEDGGAPLVGRNELIGVNAWVFGCVRNSPDVYSRVSTHRPWITFVSGVA